MRSVFTTVMALALIAGPAAFAQQSAERKAEMIQLIRDNGCSMTDQQADEVFDPLGFTYDEINAYLEEMIADGEATFDGKVVTLSAALCAASEG